MTGFHAGYERKRAVPVLLCPHFTYLANPGHRLPGLFARQTWWRRAVLRFLKARSRAISLHDYAYEKELIDAAPHKVIFPDARRRRPRKELF